MSQSSEGKEERKLGSEKWINAHYDPIASLFTFTQCIAFADIYADGDSKLILADIGTNSNSIKLKVYKGTSVASEVTILDLPTGMVSFYMDLLEPRIPAIAVGSGACIYVFKNLRPYFKFNLPSLEVNKGEFAAWTDFNNEKTSATELMVALDNVRSQIGATNLMPRSIDLLELPYHEREAFATSQKHSVITRQTAITCIATLKKSLTDDDAISCLVVGTESGQIQILDPEAFTVLVTIELESVPAFLQVQGLYDVEYTILVTCRNGGIYGIKRDSKKGKELFRLNSQPLGILRLGKNILVGCMDDTLQCYNFKGKRIWLKKMPAGITTMELLDYKLKNIQAVLVALTNCEVHVYMNQNLVDVIRTEDVVSAMKFGKFGRESESLVMITQGGGLIVKMLKRTAQFDDRSSVVGPPVAQTQKLDIPKKTKLFLDQTTRERENAIDMYRQFQQDLYRLRLETARGYVDVLQKSLTTISVDQSEPVKLHAEVTGIGPLFKLSLGVQNTSLNQPCIDLFITFDCDMKLYNIRKPFIPMPMLVPGLNYTFETIVQCLSEKAISDMIKVFVLKKNNSVPILTAIINMPASEAMVIG